MTSTITLVLGLLVVTVVFAGLAARLRVPYAIMLVLAGLLLGLIPGLPSVNLSPDIVLFLFLPPLVYSSAWQVSWQTFRANLRPILLLSIGLVLVTTSFVALVAHLFLHLSWSVAFALGAVLSPTDAVAASAIAQRMQLPGRIVTILEGESMVNDATGLVVYTFAVSAAVTGSFQPGIALVQFVLVSLGGLLIGLVVGWPLALLHRYLDDAPIEITMSLLTPFGAYLLAEAVHVSGVLATLTAGLYLSQRSPRFFSATTRLQANAVWNVLVFVLNGLLFLLIGLQLRQVFAIPGNRSFLTLVGEIVLVSIAVIVIRFAWVFAETYVPRWLSSRLRVSDPAPSWRSIVIIAWTGLRGGVSLASALALPIALQNGQVFQDRDRLIALTFGVILVTLVGQGLGLIPLIRLLGVASTHSHQEERQLAHQVSSQAVLDRLQELEGQDGIPAPSLARLRTLYQRRLEQLDTQRNHASGDFEEQAHAYRRLVQEMVQVEREAVIQLRNRRQIDDEVFREIERELDLQEERFQL